MIYRRLFLFLVLVCIIYSCRKDIGKLPNHSARINLASTIEDSIDFTCVSFPYNSWLSLPEDSITFPFKQASYWQYRPNNKKEVVYMAGPQLWSYNFITRQRYLLSENVLYLPDCNEKGWVVFGRHTDFSIYKIKTNGDSLIRLVQGGVDPQWDYSGEAIYYYNEFVNKMFKINTSGDKLDSINSGPAQFTIFSKSSNKLYYGKSVNASPSLISMNISTKAETILATDLVGRFTVDDTDENFYFMDLKSNYYPILKLNVNSKKIDTLFKNCDNILFTWPHIAKGTGKLTIACIFTKLLDPKDYPTLRRRRFLKWSKTFEMDLNDPTHKLKEVNLFP